MTTDPYDVPEAPPALGCVVEEGRGALPFALIHGEALVACASWALGDSGVTPIDLGTEWAGLVDSGEPFVLHDALCPMTPASFITACVAACVELDTVVVGSVATPGAQSPRTVTSPVVLPASVVAALDELPSLDFARLVAALQERFPVIFLDAPASSARVVSVDEIRALEELTLPAQP
jgi:2-C-methyl-D-erythritol 4-phosphate cytidylyltransferase